MGSTQQQTAAEVQQSIALLKQILEQEQFREVAYVEAQEVGRNLIEFFEVLAGAV